MSRSASNIDEEISKWGPGSITSPLQIPQGCLLWCYNQYQKDKAPFVKAAKKLSDILGYQIDEILFRSKTAKLRKEVAIVKKVISSDKRWACFLDLLKDLWTVTPRRGEVPKRSLPPVAPPKKKPLPRKLRSDCKGCVIRKAKIANLLTENETLENEYEKLKEELEQIRSELKKLKASKDDKLKKTSLTLKRTNEKLTNKHLTLVRCRGKKNNYKAELDRKKKKDPLDIARELKNEKIKTTFRDKTITKLKKQQSEMDKNLNAEINDLKKQLKQDSLYIDHLECEAEEGQNECVAVEEVPVPVVRRQYDHKTRIVMYKALQSKVPLSHVGDLVNSALTNFGLCSVAIPSAPTISRMAYEMSIFCFVQATDVLLKSPCATLGWDATSIDQFHINAIHIETPEQKFTLSIAALPGGKAVDYVCHISQTVDKMASIYSRYIDESEDGVKKRILSVITSTITDRCKVNSATVRELNRLWSTTLIELNCNLHPLDSFSSRCKTGLKSIDAEWKLPKTGRDCCVSNFLYALSKLR